MRFFREGDRPKDLFNGAMDELHVKRTTRDMFADDLWIECRNTCLGNTMVPVLEECHECSIGRVLPHVSDDLPVHPEACGKTPQATPLFLLHNLRHPGKDHPTHPGPV